MDSVNLLPTGVAAALLLAALRLLGDYVRKSPFLRRNKQEEDISLGSRVRVIERTIGTMAEKNSASDLEYRLHLIEVAAMRRGWTEIIPRGTGSD